jgi:hypothetical protein
MTYEHFKDLLLILLPPVSALAGVALADRLSSRRANEQFFAKEVMQKKLSLYEDLYEKLQELHDAASIYFEKTRLAKSKADIKHILEGPYMVGLKIAQFTDANRLFMDEDVAIHIIMTALGPSEIQDLDPKKRSYKTKIKECSEKFFSDYSIAVDMIEEYSGIQRLRRSFGKINKPKTTSDYVKYMKKMKEQYKSKS